MGNDFNQHLIAIHAHQEARAELTSFITIKDAHKVRHVFNEERKGFN